MTIKVKAWKVEQIIEEARKYHLGIRRCGIDTQGNEEYINPVAFKLEQTAPTIKETEKAVYVQIGAVTTGENWRDFKVWIPKSCIMD